MHKKTIIYLGLFLALGLPAFLFYYFTQANKAHKEPLIVDSPINLKANPAARP